MRRLERGDQRPDDFCPAHLPARRRPDVQRQAVQEGDLVGREDDRQLVGDGDGYDAGTAVAAVVFVVGVKLLSVFPSRDFAMRSSLSV